jgi:hypothetical protein
VIYIHLPGDEDLFLIKVNQFLPKSFTVDTSTESGVAKAEFFFTQYEYSSFNVEKSCTDLAGYRDCTLNNLLSLINSNLTCSITGFFSQKTKLIQTKPPCSSSESAAKSFKSMTELTKRIANNPHLNDCPTICNMSSKDNLKHKSHFLLLGTLG